MKTETKRARVVLAGLESVGKTALFRLLTGHAVGDETNVRGSTISLRTAVLADGTRLTDTPGIRLDADALTTALALRSLGDAEVVLLAARATHAGPELRALLSRLSSELAGRPVCVALTFADMVRERSTSLAAAVESALRVPVVVLDARRGGAGARAWLSRALARAKPLPEGVDLEALPAGPSLDPEKTLFERSAAGPWAAAACVASMFGLPVWASYKIAGFLQPLADAAVIEPLKARVLEAFAPFPWLADMLAGSYGILTLGWYSFLWAFPVVLLIGLSVALAEETGLKDRVTASLDPALRRVGLSGRDLIPVLTGFGCNVVAVQQSRSCSSCTRQSCVSLIAFGSACSYQIGAALSLFGAAGHPSLFLPYLSGLFLVGALHTHLWHGALERGAASPLAERAFLQPPSARAVFWRVKAATGQFLFQAMPVFLGICAAAALLQRWGILDRLSGFLSPAMGLFGLPAAAAPGIVFSIIRKDGLLVLNQGEGALAASLTAGQLFVLVYLASTLTACLVTLWAVKKEMGARTAAALAGRQALTALSTAALFGWIASW